MDPKRFDLLSKRFAVRGLTRRAAVAALAGALAAGRHVASGQSACAEWHVVLPNGTCGNPCPVGPQGNVGCMIQYCETCVASIDGQGYCDRDNSSTPCGSHAQCPSGYFCTASGWCRGACG